MLYQAQRPAVGVAPGADHGKVALRTSRRTGLTMLDFQEQCREWAGGCRYALELGSLVHSGEDARTLMRVICGLWYRGLGMDEATITRAAFIYGLLTRWESWTRHEAEECEQVVRGLELELQRLETDAEGTHVGCSRETLELLIKMLASGVSGHIDDMG